MYFKRDVENFLNTGNLDYNVALWLMIAVLFLIHVTLNSHFSHIKYCTMSHLCHIFYHYSHTVSLLSHNSHHCHSR